MTLDQVLGETERRLDTSMVTEDGRYVPDPYPKDVTVEIVSSAIRIADLLLIWDRVQGLFKESMSSNVLTRWKLEATSHYGGSAIRNPNGTSTPDCSTAFTVAVCTSRRILSAGHCGYSAPWRALLPAGNTSTAYSFRNPLSLNYGSNQHDDQVTSGSTYSPRVYVGSLADSNSGWSPASWDNSSTSIPVKGKNIPGIENRVWDPLGSAVSSAGDSGGAVFWWQYTNQLHAVGIHIGGGTTYKYHTPIDIALNDFGVSLVLG